MINLTLDGTGMVEQPEELQYPPISNHDELASRLDADIAQLKTEVEQMTPAEQQQITNFAKQIDLRNTDVIARYGESSQNQAAGFVAQSLKGVRNKDMGDTGKMLSNLAVELKGFNEEDINRTGLAKLFHGARKSVAEYQAQYTSVSKTVDDVAKELIGRRLKLLADVKVMDTLYEQNLERFKELTMYIMAGKQRIAEVQAGELQELKQKAEASGKQEDVLAVSDLEKQISQFEKRIYDLELTRTITMQLAPQLRMIQGTNVEMANKIQSTVANTIPLWSMMVATAVMLEDQRAAIEAEEAVTNLTNEMLTRNSSIMKTNAIAGAKAAERGIVDIETLEKTNEDLISTIDEIMTIQTDGREKRLAAEKRLQQIENDLKHKLLGVAKR